ncbi:MAG: SagB/ThcOx family dehydrogenase, partial [Candidatus Aerophobetes bacterium]|nr:SagB/ThcOx family dehydrogenase [Candidatus Aerophobetes bacterium]
CLEQMFIADAPVSIVITAQYERTASKYGERGIRYVHIEVGHVGQNIFLQAMALGLGTVPVGAFWDEEVSKVLNLPEEYKPVYVLPIGYPE